MTDTILTLNAGSSSLKFALFQLDGAGDPKPHGSGQVEGIGTAAHFSAAEADGTAVGPDRAPPADASHEQVMGTVFDWVEHHVGRDSLIGVGHRVVHGGNQSEPMLIDASQRQELEQFVPLAPLHQPHNLAAIDAAARLRPHLPQVACFDTAFHRTQPPVAEAFALPRALSAKGIRRYGFHGLSYEYIVSALPQRAPECVGRNLIVAHLGNGASMCAIKDGRSIATTMGFTALDGLPMGTRTGSLDPGVILYLMQHERMDAAAIEDLLYRRSGLLGVSGVSSDMRELVASQAAESREAVDLFVYRACREIGSLAAALGGVDALIFTAGIGEHAAPVRERICQGSAWLGVSIDEAANRAGGPRISQPESRVSAWVIPTDENLTIARHTRQVLETARSS